MKSFLEVSVHFHPRRQKKKVPTYFSSREESHPFRHPTTSLSS